MITARAAQLRGPPLVGFGYRVEYSGPLTLRDRRLATMLLGEFCEYILPSLVGGLGAQRIQQVALHRLTVFRCRVPKSLKIVSRDITNQDIRHSVTISHLIAPV